MYLSPQMLDVPQVLDVAGLVIVVMQTNEVASEVGWLLVRATMDWVARAMALARALVMGPSDLT